MNSPHPGSDRAAPILPKKRNAQIRFYCQLLASARQNGWMPAETYHALEVLRTARERIRCYRSSCLNDLDVASAIRTAHSYLRFPESMQPLVNGKRSGQKPVR